MIVATSDGSKNGMSTTEYDLAPMNSAMAAYLEDLGWAMEHGSMITGCQPAGFLRSRVGEPLVLRPRPAADRHGLFGRTSDGGRELTPEQGLTNPAIAGSSGL